jgi:Holliday junction resolvase-like predicted endonuclease
MVKKKMKVIFFLSFMFPFTLFARPQFSIEEDFQKLKNIPADYRSFGAVCEQVARLRLKKKYLPPLYKILVGLEYRNSRRTLGELDIVVYSEIGQRVFLTAEVKCWKNLKAALSKARKQLKRFYFYRRGQEKIFFYPKEKTAFRFQKSHFSHSQEMIISQKSKEVSSFDLDLGLTIRELQSLRKRLLYCQKRGFCPRFDSSFFRWAPPK